MKAVRRADGTSPAFRRLQLAEVCTVLSICFIALMTARPLLEEWELVSRFGESGIAAFGELIGRFPLRPLQLVPFSVMWLAGEGQPIGFGIGFALLLLATYGVARWSVTPVLSGPSRWVFASLAAILPLWPGAWLVRFAPARLSEIFVLVALGAGIRMFRGRRVGWMTVAAFSVALALATYQALFLCLLALPVILWIGQRAQDPAMMTASQRPTSTFGLFGLSLGVGVLIYAAYAWVVMHVSQGSSYEVDLASTQWLTSPDGFLSVVRSLYETAFGASPWVAPTLVWLLALFAYSVVGSAASDARGRMRWIAALLACVILLPLAALPYGLGGIHVRDPERVLFPTVVGFALVVFMWMQRRADGRTFALTPSVAAVTVAAVVLGGYLSSRSAIDDFNLQVDVIAQIDVESRSVGASDVLIRDETGRLGDTYTLYPPIVEQAFRARGLAITGTICTPLGVDRIHPRAQRFPIPSTERCEDLDLAGRTPLVLTARWDGDRIRVEPEPVR